jgi:hypothetical protein
MDPVDPVASRMLHEFGKTAQEVRNAKTNDDRRQYRDVFEDSQCYSLKSKRPDKRAFCE